MLTHQFCGEAIEWRGPAPFVFVPVPSEVAGEIRAVARRVSYGWGVIPAEVTIGHTRFTTSLFPKDGGYLVPVKKVAQVAEGVEVGGRVEVILRIDLAEE